MSKEFNCPSCSVTMVFVGGESIFQTCKSCHAPVIVPSEFLYKNSERLASENFASLANDIPVDVEQVTNELTPGSKLPSSEDVIDPEARIEKFEVYQEKIGTRAIEAKRAVDAIVSPEVEAYDPEKGYKSPFENMDSELVEISKPQKRQINPLVVRIQNELNAGDASMAINLFREKFVTSLDVAKEAVTSIGLDERIDFSKFEKRKK